MNVAALVVCAISCKGASQRKLGLRAYFSARACTGGHRDELEKRQALAEGGARADAERQVRQQDQGAAAHKSCGWVDE